jgi:hypothetical protein
MTKLALTIMTPLAAYVRIWAFSVLCRTLTRAGAELVFNDAVCLGCIAAFCFPLQPAALLLGFGTRVASLLTSMPYIHDSQHWCLHTDLAVMAAIVGALWQRARAAKPGPWGRMLAQFEPDGAAAVVAEATGTIRVQYLLFYSAAALYKANAGFLDPYFSCAPVFILQLVEQNVPAALLPAALLDLLTAAAPGIILGTEALVPVLLWVEPRVGVAFAALCPGQARVFQRP